MASKLPEISRSFIQKLLKQGKVTVNGVVAPARFRVANSDQIILDYDLDKIYEYPKIKLPIIYEDDDCLVINKPIGVLSHSKGAFNPEATVETFIRDKVKGLESDRGGIVHRLDRATSGVMICAKTPAAKAWLQKQFSSRKVKKTYIAVVSGHLKQPLAIIDLPIGRNPRAPATFRVDSNGKRALTTYRVLKTSNNYSLVELEPQTGRTHQLRVHLAHLGHPIVGDTFYNGKPAERLYLHAEALKITLPNQQRQKFSIKPPKMFTDILKNDG